tara:strand:+ start:410 stop:565 length:156 start_codon:yes stop_codon:yes gene_type:complete
MDVLFTIDEKTPLEDRKEIEEHLKHADEVMLYYTLPFVTNAFIMVLEFVVQ